MKLVRAKARNLTHGSILCREGRDVLEGPLYVLVLCELAGEGAGLVARHAQDAVVRRQHGAVKHHHVLVLVVSSGIHMYYVFYTLCLEGMVTVDYSKS